MSRNDEPVFGQRRQFTSRHEPVLGTTLEISGSVRSLSARAVEKLRTDLAEAALREADRLSKIFSVYDPASELCRWRATATIGSRTQISSELADLMVLSLNWTRSSGGIYNPLIGELTDRWRQAEVSGIRPSEVEVLEIAQSLTNEPYAVERKAGGVGPAEVTVLTNCSALSFNALAKGLVVDRVLEKMWTQFSCDRLLINAGGDLLVRSGDAEPAVRVGIEHPTIVHANQPPVKVVSLRNAGLATSGSGHRCFSVGTQTFSHLIDTRTGWPIDQSVVAASVTVVASSAATADVLATIGAVVPIDGLVAAVEAIASVEAATIGERANVGGRSNVGRLAVGAVSTDEHWSTNEHFRMLSGT